MQIPECVKKYINPLHPAVAAVAGFVIGITLGYLLGL